MVGMMTVDRLVVVDRRVTEVKDMAEIVEKKMWVMDMALDTAEAMALVVVVADKIVVAAVEEDIEIAALVAIGLVVVVAAVGNEIAAVVEDTETEVEVDTARQIRQNSSVVAVENLHSLVLAYSLVGSVELVDHIVDIDFFVYCPSYVTVCVCV